MKHSKWVSKDNEGKLNTPWDIAYQHSLIRDSSCPDEAPYILEFGVNYFVLKLEKMGIKTLWSCEGHPNGFYLVFVTSPTMARKIAYASANYSIDVNIARLYDHRKGKKGWIPNAWGMNFLPTEGCIDMSYEQRNYLLRALSVTWEEKL